MPLKDLLIDEKKSKERIMELEDMLNRNFPN